MPTGPKGQKRPANVIGGGDVDYGQLVKLYGPSPEGPTHRYSPAEFTG